MVGNLDLDIVESTLDFGLHHKTALADAGVLEG
jgi:hypothetical protein